MMSGNFRGFSCTFVARNIHVAAMFYKPLAQRTSLAKRGNGVEPNVGEGGGVGRRT